MKRGSITIGAIAIGTTVLLTAVGYIVALSGKHNTDVKDIRGELSQKGETISALGANVGSLKEDVGVIKSDIKELLQRIPKK